MRPNYCFTCFRMSILVALICTLAAESEDYDCTPEIKVRRHTVYNTSLGENLWIKCPVTFCNSSQPPIYWYKRENNAIPINFSRSTHIKTEWKISTPVEGISLLIFQNIQKSDSGLYRCETGGSVSHIIKVSVYDNVKRPNDIQKNVTVSDIEAGRTSQDALWPFVYRVAGLVVFVIIVITLFVASECGSKGVHCARKSKNTQDLSPQPLPGGSPAHQHALPTFHIYEDDSDYINVPS